VKHLLEEHLDLDDDEIEVGISAAHEWQRSGSGLVVPYSHRHVHIGTAM
jgi:hypothetical protein